MNWIEWRDHLEELVGLGSGSQKAYLLVPRTGRDDLSTEHRKDLADAVHNRLFSTRLSARHQLRRLMEEPAKESLPLLYLSAWIARHQETAHAFWPPFHAVVVRSRLSGQTVQQTLAPLISTLWMRAHLDLGIYRPQEGYAHIKWPQAHAGLTREEIQLLSRIVATNTGVPDEPPDELYGEPSEFLALLRIWLQSESQIPRRLSRLVFGQDGPASVVAELTQRVLLHLWPPEYIPAAASSGRIVKPSFIRLDLRPPRLSVIVPAGCVPGYTTLRAHYAGNEVHLETSYYERTDMTSYESHECPIVSMPWPPEVVLTGCESSVHMKVIPECHFTKGRLGLIMFDPTTGRCIRRWRPRHHYWLLIDSVDVPEWVSMLFTDIETEDTRTVAGIDVTILSAMGRDIVRELGEDGALRVLQDMEGHLSRSAALITLPDYEELLQPELTYAGGLPIAQGSHPVYLEGGSPLVVIENIPESDMALSLYNRDDTGHESLLASISLDGMSHPDPTVLELPQLIKGFYVIRSKSLREPRYFRLTSDLPHMAYSTMDVSIRLLRTDQVASADDMRHFQDQGVEVRSWPFARVTLTVWTAAGSYASYVRMDCNGMRIVRAHDVDLPQTAEWAKIQANAWLAVSEPLEIVLRPYVAPDDWIIEDRRLTARVRGVDAGTGCVLVGVADKPWRAGISETQGKVGADSQTGIDMPAMLTSGWIILMDAAHSGAWLLSRIGEDLSACHVEDFWEVYHSEFTLPYYLTTVELADDDLHQMCSLARLADLVRRARIPSGTDPLPEAINTFLHGLQSVAFRAVELTGAWPRRHATLECGDGPSGDGLLAVDGGRFRVYVDADKPEIKLTWGEDSSPCLCGDCRRIMTQQQWHRHRHGDSLVILPRGFLARPLVDWSSVVDTAEHSLMDAIIGGSTSPPHGLDDIWISLECSYSKVKRSISPEDWVKSVFASWRNLFRLVNDAEADYDWVSLWKSVEHYEDALVDLAMGKE